MAQWDFFREEVKRQRTTQEYVAGKAGMSLNTLQGKITKNIEPKLGEAFELARVMRVPIHRLFPELVPNGYEVLVDIDSWLEEHRQLIEDLKTLPPDNLAEKEDMIHTAAERVRRDLGKDSESGGA